MLYKFNYKENSRINTQVIEADDIEKAAALMEQWCKELGFEHLHICPFVFDIQAYLEASDGGRNILGNPAQFGRQIERRRLQSLTSPVLELDSKVPGVPKPAKS